MKILNEAIKQKIRKEYPIGTRITLINMEDVQAPPVGTQGEVVGMDDIGTLKINWDNGSGLGVIYGLDAFEKVREMN